jgi:peptidoglycan/LPS O-acetylase OafA/YrhL
MNSGTSNFLSASRWVAAFFVVLYHVYSLSITNYHGVPPSLLLRGAKFFGGFGHIAVIVFFVISGFLVGGRTILNLQNKGFSITDYFCHRFSRIYTVLIPALVVGFILDWLGINIFNGSGIYNHPEQFYTNPFGNNIAEHLSFKIFVGNLMQLQTIIVTSLGSNGPLWSLANEWWYYVLFAFCVIAYRAGRMLTRAIAGGAILAMVIVLPLTISLWFVVWAIGAGVAVLDRYWAGPPFSFGATIAAVCLIAVQWIESRAMYTPGVATDFAFDLTVALGYSAALVCAKNLKHPRRFWTLHRTLATFSYTVYLVHFPAMMFAAAMMKDVFDVGFSRQPSVAALVYAGALLTILYGYAWIFATFTEAHTDAVRSRLSLIVSALRYRANSLAHAKVFEGSQRRGCRAGERPRVARCSRGPRERGNQ